MTMTIDDKTRAGVTVLCAQHPFTRAADRHIVQAGASVQEILLRVLPDPAQADYYHADLNGHPVPRKLWRGLRPKAGTHLRFTAVPQGGGHGRKNPLRTVLSLALLAASPMIAGAITGVLGVSAETAIFGVSLGRIVATGVNLAGRLALNALAPPGRPRLKSDAKDSPTLFLQGARNQARPFSRVPKVLGKHRCVPPMGALPYTETAGDAQYLRMLFVWGYGPLNISDLKIGETPLTNFSDVEVETRAGYQDDAPITLYPASVLQNDLDVALKAADGYVLRTTEEEADEISIDITLARGLFAFTSAGGRRAASVQVEVQYAPAGTSNWSAPASGFNALMPQTLVLQAPPQPYVYNGQSVQVGRYDIVTMDAASGAYGFMTGSETRLGIDAQDATPPAVPAGTLALARIARRSDEPADIGAGAIADCRASIAQGTFETASDFELTAAGGTHVHVAGGGLSFAGFTLAAKQTSALRKNITFKVPRGQYDVRLRRLTADATSDDVFDETAWTALRTVRHAPPVSMQGLAMTAVRIKATDQLNGVIDQFNGVVHSIVPDWNGTAWVEQPTSNPAALFRHVLQGTANARPLADDRLALEAITAWHATCAAAAREYNAVIDYDTSVRDVLRDVAAAGRASPALLDGKWSVVEDKPLYVPVQHFTPRNSYGFQGQKSFDETPTALRVRFINRARGWAQDERLVFDDGESAQTALRYETLELPGVTSAQQAWEDGRYHIATARLRPETYSFSCDIEHLVCTRGDLVRFTHDVPLFGLMSARVKTVAFSSDGTLMTSLTLDAAMPMESGTSYALRLRTQEGVSVVSSLATIAGESAIVVLSPPLQSSCGVQAGDLALFGQSGQESVELVVKSIAPQGDLAARLTCVDAAPAVHTAGAGTIPPHESKITLPPALRRPPAPLLLGVQSGAEALIRNADGSLSTRIVVTLKAPAWQEPLTPQVMIRAADETQFHPADATAHGTRLYIADVAEGETYDVRIRYLSSAGGISDALLITAHRVEGATALPANVQSLSANVLGDSVHVSWPAVADIDLDHYALRFSPQTTGAVWSGAIDIVARVPPAATAITLPAANGTYFIKAVDTGGRPSAAAASVAVYLQGIAGYNAVLTMDEGAAFAGARTNMALDAGTLRLDGAPAVDAWDNWDEIFNVDIGLGLAASGSYAFAAPADVGAVYTCRITAAMSVNGADLSNGIDAWDAVDAVESFDQTADPALWTLQLFIRTTADDPASDLAQWSAWQPFVIGDYTARGFAFKLEAASFGNSVTPVISALCVSIDMPDRIAAEDGLAAPASGCDVAFVMPFRAVPAVAIAPHAMSSGDYYVLSAKTNAGFHVQFYDASGTGIARTFDYMAQGYGAALS